MVPGPGPGIPYNRTQVIQTALVLLGFPIIQSIQAGGASAQAMDNLYSPLMAADLSSPNWRFANKVVQLSQVAGVNPGFMQYNTAYQIPPDCLAVWQVYPNVPYDVFGERIWTTGNQKLQMSYRALGPESKFPAAYIMYFIHLLAATAGIGITKEQSVLDKIEAGLTKWRAQAMIVNTQGRPNQGITNSTWVQSRATGTPYNTIASS